MNNRPLSREEMAKLWTCMGNMIVDYASISDDYEPIETNPNYQRGLAILTPPDLMTEPLCAERLAKNNPFSGME